MWQGRTSLVAVRHNRIAGDLGRQQHRVDSSIAEARFGTGRGAPTDPVVVMRLRNGRGQVNAPQNPSRRINTESPLISIVTVPSSLKRIRWTKESGRWRNALDDVAELERLVHRRNGGRGPHPQRDRCRNDHQLNDNSSCSQHGVPRYFVARPQDCCPPPQYTAVRCVLDEQVSGTAPPVTAPPLRTVRWGSASSLESATAQVPRSEVFRRRRLGSLDGASSGARHRSRPSTARRSENSPRRGRRPSRSRYLRRTELVRR